MNLIIICGGTGSGKSRLTNERLLKNNVIFNRQQNKDNYTLSLQSKNQYVFDLNNEYHLPIDNILRPQMRHIECDAKKFIHNCKQIRNCNIVFEDASGFLRGKQSAELTRLIVQRRHVNNNWIILFHSINRVPPELMEYCNYLILFKTGDNIKDIDIKFSNPVINSNFLEVQKLKQHSYIQIKML